MVGPTTIYAMGTPKLAPNPLPDPGEEWTLLRGMGRGRKAWTPVGLVWGPGGWDLSAKIGRIGFSICLELVSQRPEKRFIIFALKGSLVKDPERRDLVFSIFGVLKALLLDLKASLAWIFLGV